MEVLKISLDPGTILTSLLFLLFLSCVIFFPFLRQNKFFGIRTRKTLEDEYIWKKVHLIAGLATIPFLVVFLLILFVENGVLKNILSGGVSLVIAIMYLIIAEIVSRSYYKKRPEKND